MKERGADAELAIGRLVLELVHLRMQPQSATQSSGAHAARDDDRAPRARMSPQAIRASMELYQRGELTMSELATALGVSAGWATRVVEELVSEGFVERSSAAHDRRIVRVRLAPAALEMASTAYRWRSELVERALEGLGPTERAAVRTFLDRIVAGPSGASTTTGEDAAP